MVFTFLSVSKDKKERYFIHFKINSKIYFGRWVMISWLKQLSAFFLPPESAV